MRKCKAACAPEFGKSKKGQDIPLSCDKDGKHRVHEDKKVGAKFIKFGAGDVVWPAKKK